MRSPPDKGQRPYCGIYPETVFTIPLFCGELDAELREDILQHRNDLLKEINNSSEQITLRCGHSDSPPYAEIVNIFYHLRFRFSTVCLPESIYICEQYLNFGLKFWQKRQTAAFFGTSERPHEICRIIKRRVHFLLEEMFL